MRPLVAFILGIVEGITEYLPVSSTGHLVVAAHLLRTKPGAFEIVIQLGAILAVLVHYRSLLGTRTIGLLRRDPKAITLFLSLLAGFVPTAILGLLLRKTIKAHLFGPIPVAIGFIVGAVVMIVAERALRATAKKDDSLDAITPRRAFAIGVGQCFALWPGASRSMCTIVAGKVTGLSTRTAAEFSFLLGLPTLGAATLYEAYKSHTELTHDVGLLNVAIGLVTSFLVAWAVIAAFLRYLERRGLEPFAYYRIVAGILILFLFPSG